ncbi:MAG: amidohydrolase [Gemmatimonadales bacterium]|nr:amidohydrolase [Gemmatimonadales bacterium]
MSLVAWGREVVAGSALALVAVAPLGAQGLAPERLARLKAEAHADVEARKLFTAQLIDQLFSYGELGFQELETSRTLVTLLRKNGFTVEEGTGGLPTGWVARWGSGRPVIAIGSDLDGIPQASQMPGVACRLPIVPGAPGHGEGHNSGQAMNLTAILAVKRLMERERLPGTLVVWPGVAEEQLGGKAHLVRAGAFRDADIAIFSHVSDSLSTAWGQARGSGLVSVLYSFEGKAAHAAGAPWRGRSALDAATLMEVGWNFRREHIRFQSRSHSVIVDGGDQPNVVPTTASIWWYFRELEPKLIRELWAVGDSVAQGAAMMTGTTLQPTRLLGSAWPAHYNRPLARALTANMLAVGMPEWDDRDQQLARAVQKELGVKETGLVTKIDTLAPPVPVEKQTGGGSDDIGDVSWSVPTVPVYFPSNIPNLPGHHWSNAIAMATPIAHKGATQAAKALAGLLLDVLGTPALVDSAKAYFAEQTKEVKYEPFLRPEDRPPTHLNAAIMAKYRPELRKKYFDPSKHRSYMEQLGIPYPTVRGADGSCGGGGAQP